MSYSSQYSACFFTPLIRKYNYISVSSQESFLSLPFYIKDIYRQEEVIEDWNEPTMAKFQTIYLNSLEGDTDCALDTIFWQQYPTLVSFFSAQMVDIPKAFRTSKSLYSPSMSTPQLRLITMIMTQGRKSYVSRLYSASVHSLLYKLAKRVEDTRTVLHWQLYYTVFSNIQFHKVNIKDVDKVWTSHSGLAQLTDKFKQPYSSINSSSLNHHWASTLINDELLTYLPLFSFYIRKVDKMKRKHSRGKSGKYSIIWKYVPKYRRFIVVLRWLLRDIKFQKSKTLLARINHSIETLLFDKPNHLVYKFRNFVHHFVFQHYRKTLLRSLRSVS